MPGTVSPETGELARAPTLGVALLGLAEGKETTIGKCTPATEDPFLISPLAWVHYLQSTAEEVQNVEANLGVTQL